MNKRDALRLKRGDRILFGNSMWSRNVDKWESGTVLFVTKNGGVRVACSGGIITWVPYHFIFRKAD